jgi:hypothetical protein
MFDLRALSDHDLQAEIARLRATNQQLHLQLQQQALLLGPDSKRLDKGRGRYAQGHGMSRDKDNSKGCSKGKGRGKDRGKDKHVSGDKDRKKTRPGALTAQGLKEEVAELRAALQQELDFSD